MTYKCGSSFWGIFVFKIKKKNWRTVRTPFLPFDGGSSAALERMIYLAHERANALWHQYVSGSLIGDTISEQPATSELSMPYVFEFVLLWISVGQWAFLLHATFLRAEQTRFGGMNECSCYAASTALRIGQEEEGAGIGDSADHQQRGERRSERWSGREEERRAF